MQEADYDMPRKKVEEYCDQFLQSFLVGSVMSLYLPIMPKDRKVWEKYDPDGIGEMFRVQVKQLLGEYGNLLAIEYCVMLGNKFIDKWRKCRDQKRNIQQPGNS